MANKKLRTVEMGFVYYNYYFSFYNVFRLKATTHFHCSGPLVRATEDKCSLTFVDHELNFRDFVLFYIFKETLQTERRFITSTLYNVMPLYHGNNYSASAR